MGLVIAKTVRLDRKAYKPGDEDALSEVATKKQLTDLQKMGLLVDVPEQKTVKPKTTTAKAKADAEE